MMLLRLWRSTFGLVALVAIGFALATVAIGAIAYEITHEALEEQLDHRIAMEVSALLAEAREDGIAGLIEAIRKRDEAPTDARLEYLLVDARGRRLAGRMVATLPVADGYEEHLSYSRDGRRGVAQSITTSIQGARMVVAADRRGLKEIDALLQALFGVALAAMLVLGVVAAALVAWITRRRLSRIDRTAVAIIGGQFDRRIPQDGSDSEFDRLAGTLNRMLDRMAGLMDNLRQVSSDVAHDLRTPLTRLHNRLDRALDRSDLAQQVREIEEARGEAAELLDIFASVLRIAEVEGMAERLPKQAVDLSSLLNQMAETYEPDMEVSGHRLQVEVAPAVVVMGDRRLLSQAVANLLDNALNHTPSGTVVTLSLGRVGDVAELCVADDGPGVSEAEPERLFQRFARSEKSRSTPGHGLGLALVSAIAAAHGGRAALNPPPGFGITLVLPVRPVERPERG
ncbi:MAG: ATP-binding protein [Sphingobium sp.]